MLRYLTFNFGQRNFIALQPGDTLLRPGVAFIGDIVGAAGEGIDDLDRRAQSARKQDRGNRKVLVMREGLEGRLGHGHA